MAPGRFAQTPPGLGAGRRGAPHYNCRAPMVTHTLCREGYFGLRRNRLHTRRPPDGVRGSSQSQTCFQMDDADRPCGSTTYSKEWCPAEGNSDCSPTSPSATVLPLLRGPAARHPQLRRRVSRILVPSHHGAVRLAAEHQYVLGTAWANPAALAERGVLVLVDGAGHLGWSVGAPDLAPGSVILLDTYYRVDRYLYCCGRSTRTCGDHHYQVHRGIERSEALRPGASGV